MKLYNLLLATLFLPNITKAQAVFGPGIQFTYDAAGNRILREYKPSIQLNKGSKSINETSPADTIKESANGKNIIVKAYPNPTDEVLNFQNLTWDLKDRALVKVFDITGKFIQSKVFSQAVDHITLTGIATGSYSVHYYLNDKLLTTWTIIKK